MQPFVSLTYPYSTISHDTIKVSIHPVFLKKNMHITHHDYSWVYYVAIENLSEETWAVKKCNLTIIGEKGESYQIDAGHFGGTQSVLQSKGSFEYNLGATLSIPSAIIYGTYEMYNTTRDETLYVDLPPFSLDSPSMKRLMH